MNPTIYETCIFSGALLSTFTDFEDAYKEYLTDLRVMSIRVIGTGVTASLSSRVEIDAYRDSLKANQYWDSQIDKPRDTGLVDGNLKTAAAQGKPKLSDVPPVAFFALGAAMSDGAAKYGRYNWRETGSTASVFYDAMQRHLNAWYSGEDYAPDSKVHHLGHLMASCAILLDSELYGQLNDDREKGVNPLLNPMWKTNG